MQLPSYRAALSATVALACCVLVLPSSYAVEVSRSITQTHGLLVLPLEGHRFAGKASQMTAAALPQPGNDPAVIGFNQNVGPQMGKALEEVVKFTRMRHQGWPTGRKIELSFAEPYSPKDGPSAAVATALLLESMLSGAELDPRFAVTGDLGIDGSVRPVGGIGGKLRGAVLGNCTMVAIPRDNVQAVMDLVISEGLDPLLTGHVVALADFDDALSLAFKEKTPEVTQALAGFEHIQEVARRRGGSTVALMRHPSTQERLVAVIDAVPQHLSARLLLQAGRGQLPQRLSLPGSLEAMDQSGYDLLTASKAGQGGGRLNEDQLRDAVARIRLLRPMLHEDTIRLSDNLLNLGQKVVAWRDRDSSGRHAERLYGELRAAADAVGAEWSRLLQDPKVVEQLMR